MTKPLVIKLPDELEQQLIEQANKLNISLETFVMQSLAKVVSVSTTEESDPLLPLLGTLTATVSDVGENHDRYLANAWQQESGIAK
jgi:hypothetical protein